MKKFVLTLGLVLALGSVTFAQDLTTEPTKLAEKHYNEAKKLLTSGNASKAAVELVALNKYENGKVYTVRNKDSKKDEYYYSQEELDKAIAGGNYAKPKTQDLTPKYTLLINSEVSNLANKTLEEANAALDKKDYKTAAPKFVDIYNLTKALGATDELYKYQAAISYYNANDFTNSLNIIKELAAANFTGKTETQTKDYNRDLYVLALNNLYTSKTYDPILDEALAKYPNDADISTLATAIYQLTGNGEKMKSQLEESIKINPNDQASLYNLGTLSFADDTCDNCLAEKEARVGVALNESVNDVLKVAGAVGPITEDIRSDLCYQMRGQQDSIIAPSLSVAEYNLLELAGIQNVRTSKMEERREKLSAFWNTYAKDLECDDIAPPFPKGNYFKQLVAGQYSRQLRALLMVYRLNPNVIDKSDGCTVLDYLEKYRRAYYNEGSEVLKKYLDETKTLLLRMGAKSANDLGGKC